MTSLRRSRPAAALFAAGLLLVARPGGLAADAGVALDLREVRVEDQLDPGRRYELPRLTVRNPGDDFSQYAMAAGGVENDDLLDPDDSWFTFDPDSFELEPAQSQVVSVSLQLPSDASPGDYYGLLRAELMPAGEGPLVGVAAAAEMSFTVTEPGDLGAFIRRLAGLFTDLLPWSAFIPITLLLAAAALWLRRHFRIRIEAK